MSVYHKLRTKKDLVSLEEDLTILREYHGLIMDTLIQGKDSVKKKSDTPNLKYLEQSTIVLITCLYLAEEDNKTIPNNLN